MIQLDTSFLIRALAAGSSEDARLRQWLRRHERFAISAPAWAEFRCGPVGSGVADVARHIVGEPLPFGAIEAERAAELFNESGRRRGSFMDCMIAAVAIEGGDRLATSNAVDFVRFERFGLELI